MKFKTITALVLAAMAGTASAQTIYLATGTGISNSTPTVPPQQTLYSLNAASCTVSTVGSMGDSITAMDFDAAGNLFGIRATDFTPPYTLYSINLATGAATTVIDLNDGAGGDAPGNFPDMAHDPVSGTWYAWTEDSDDLSQFDPGTGTVTVLGDAYPGSNPSAGSGTSVDSSGTIWTIPCSGCGDGVRAVNGNGEERGGGVIADALYTVDPTTGLASFVVQLTGEDLNSTINAMDFAADDTLWAIEGGFCGDTNCPTRLVTVDTATGVITEVCPQAALPVGVDAMVVAGIGPAAVAVPLMNHWMFLAIALLLGSLAAFQVWRRQA